MSWEIFDNEEEIEEYHEWKPGDMILRDEDYFDAFDFFLNLVEKMKNLNEEIEKIEKSEDAKYLRVCMNEEEKKRGIILQRKLIDLKQRQQELFQEIYNIVENMLYYFNDIVDDEIENYKVEEEEEKENLNKINSK